MNELECALRPSGFFVLRTPLLPFDEFAAWGAHAGGGEAEREQLRLRLRNLAVRSEVREAVLLASPSLEASVQKWLADPESRRGRKVERALVRYFARMCGRPTPFGLLAGHAVGEVCPEGGTVLELEPRERYRRHTRLALDYLSRLSDAWIDHPPVREVMRYRPNSTLYSVGHRMRYVETKSTAGVHTHQLAEIEVDEALRATLERARPGARATDLARALCGADVSSDDAEQYVASLIKSQVLTPGFGPLLTGSADAESWFAEIPALAAVAGRLSAAHETMRSLDRSGLIADPALYRRLSETLEADWATSLEVELIKPSLARLGGEVLDEIVDAVGILHRIGGVAFVDRFAAFRRAFVERYEGQEVPLAEALDEENGIGFDGMRTQVAESRWGSRQAHLLRLLDRSIRAGAGEVSLGEDDVEALSAPQLHPLPNAFAVLATIAAADADALNRGRFRVMVETLSGPSGARLLGRHCLTDGSLREHVSRHLREEEALEPHAVFAEVVHLPEQRPAITLRRPVLREYEIPYLGVSGAPIDRQIPIADLTVSVVGDRVVLRSRRLQREVIPRLTSPANYNDPRAPGVYRFLCALQEQGVQWSAGWRWGSLEDAPFLPRVALGRKVLARARWRLGRDDLAGVDGASAAQRFHAVQKLRDRLRLPRFVLLVEGESELPVDLDNPLSVDSIFPAVLRGGVLRELFPAPAEIAVSGPEGRFVSELVIPFVANAGPRPARTQPATSVAAPAVVRRHPPGSPWLFAKLYTGPATADRILRDTIAPIVRAAIDAGDAKLWFFTRVADPSWHLRIRILGEPARVRCEHMCRLQKAAAALMDEGLLWRVQLDTYVREVERYGGPEGIELAEQIFHVDSEATLGILEAVPEEAWEDMRWRLALASIDRLLSDLGFSLADKLAWAQRRQPGLRQASDPGELAIERRIARQYREERAALSSLLAPDADAPGLVCLRERSRRMAPIAAALVDLNRSGRLSRDLGALAGSYAHMAVNRICRSEALTFERVACALLLRLYDSTIARGTPDPFRS